jgi:uncharacterized protein (DUF924 family)
MDWQGEVLDFWFGLRPDQWWKTDAELDRACRHRFHQLWEEQRQMPASHFLGSARDAVAAVILFDQLPRNMFRGHADQFATDILALAIAKAAVERGLDDQMSPGERGFLYMPFQHSEDLGDQERSLGLFAALADEEQLKFAKKHHEVIERFGRFPHRNAILGRSARGDEIAAGNVTPW